MRLNPTALITALAVAQGTVGLPVVTQPNVVHSIANINDKNQYHHQRDTQHQQPSKRSLNAKTIDLIMSTLSVAVGVHSGLKFVEIYRHLRGIDHADSDR